MHTSHRRWAVKSSGNEVAPPAHLQHVSDHEQVGLVSSIELVDRGSYGSHNEISQLGLRRSIVQLSEDLSSTIPHEQGRDHDHDEDQMDDDDEDEDEEPLVWTSRVMFLGSISCLSLLIINKFFMRRTSECIMAMASAVVILYVLGYIMSKLLPKRMVYFPSLGLEISLNPGPFGPREYAMVCIIANLGGTYGGITSYSVDWWHD